MIDVFRGAAGRHLLSHSAWNAGSLKAFRWCFSNTVLFVSIGFMADLLASQRVVPCQLGRGNHTAFEVRPTVEAKVFRRRLATVLETTVGWPRPSWRQSLAPDQRPWPVPSVRKTPTAEAP